MGEFYEITYRVKWEMPGSHGEAPFEDPLEMAETVECRARLGFTVTVTAEHAPVEMFWSREL
jgi:hypothetical protein